MVEVQKSYKESGGGRIYSIFKHLQHYLKIYVCSTLLWTVGVRLGLRTWRSGTFILLKLINAIYLQSFDGFCEKRS